MKKMKRVNITNIQLCQTKCVTYMAYIHTYIHTYAAKSEATSWEQKLSPLPS